MSKFDVYICKKAQASSEITQADPRICFNVTLNEEYPKCLKPKLKDYIVLFVTVATWIKAGGSGPVIPKKRFLVV